MIGLVKQLIDQLVLRRDPARVDVRPGVVVVHKKPRERQGGADHR